MSRAGFEAARRVVIKAGSSLLQAGPDTLAAIAADIAALRQRGTQVVLVSSGAVALGRARLGLEDQALSLEQKQAAAAAGQPRLIALWDAALDPHGLVTAQALLTLDVTDSRRSWLNARATLQTLMALGAIAIINENDTIATDEIRYGDNDRLAARVAQLVEADLLVLLSDIDGLYEADPRKCAGARKLDDIPVIDDRIRAMAGEANAEAAVGTGGMRTKLMAAELAGRCGCATAIALGSAARPVLSLADPAQGSWFHPSGSVRNARERWIAGASSPQGEIRIDAGAVTALRSGKSLLAVGVTGVTGSFDRGDAVRITGPDGADVARGVASYASSDAQRVAGCRSEEIEARLGYRRSAAIVHVDDLVLASPTGGAA